MLHTICLQVCVSEHLLGVLVVIVSCLGDFCRCGNSLLSLMFLGEWLDLSERAKKNFN